jgi:hypothetical protein
MKILNLEFDFLFQFESNSNLASTIIQRINSSTRLLFINFEVYMQNLVQFTHKQGHTEWTGPRTRSARHNARARRHHAAVVRGRTTAGHQSLCVT